MSACPETERFAALLRSLKSRSGLSYEALARKSGLAGSTLHRYCRGTSVPQDYGSVHRLATVCGATPEELRTLHRLWALADAARAAAAGAGTDGAHGPVAGEGADGAEPDAPHLHVPPGPATDPSPAAHSGSGTHAGAAAHEGPATRPGAGEGAAAHEGPITPTGTGEGEGAAPHEGPATQPTRASTANPAPATHPVPDTHPASPPTPDAAPPSAPPSAPVPPQGGEQPDAEPAAPVAARSRRRRLRSTVVTAALIAAVGVSAWALSNGRSPSGGSGQRADVDRPLFSANCPPVIAMGEHDECVREVQRLLHAKGADIGVDGDFGPQTLRRVTAFQVLAGLQPNGVVGEPTKKALYASKVRMSVWPQRKVRERVRKVFPEAPDKAVAIADCQSFLDPLHILPNTNGTRNWGLFQISDARLRDLGGTPREALDPEWNIQAARKLWSRDRDFGDWPHCERAADAPRSPTPRHTPTTARPPS